MAVNGGEVAAYGIMIERMCNQAGKAARSKVSRWLGANTPWEAADLRRAAAIAVSEAVAEYGGACASLACDLYDSIMVGEGMSVPSAEPWEGDCTDKVLAAVRYQMRKALDGDVDAFLDAVEEMARYYVRQHANNTTMQNVERDNVQSLPGALSPEPANGRGGGIDMPTSRGGSGMRRRRSYPQTARRVGDVAFARVPTGRETCTYCMMLASRGFVYRSAESAGHADHRGCNCMIVPGRYMQSAIDGIDMSAQYDCWRELEELEAYAAKHPDEIDAHELERRKKQVVDGYDGISLPTAPAEVRKLASRGPMSWYEPRERMADSYEPR